MPNSNSAPPARQRDGRDDGPVRPQILKIPEPSSDADHDRLASTVIRKALGYGVADTSVEAVNASETIWAPFYRAVCDTRNPTKRAKLLATFPSGSHGFGDIIRAAIERARSVVEQVHDDPEIDALQIDEEEQATLQDALDLCGSLQYVWNRFIPRGQLSIIAAGEGHGKTRFCVDLTHRLWFKIDWPDGEENTFPAETLTIWVMADNNQPETGQAAMDLGLPPRAILLNTGKSKALEVPILDDPDFISRLRRWIERSGALVVFIDTVTFATSASLSKQDEVARVFTPLSRLAVEMNVAIVCLAHLNSNGGVFGKRLTGLARSVVTLTYPDPEGEPTRRKIEVTKSATKKPPAMGLTFHDNKVTYDFDPPVDPEKEELKAIKEEKAARRGRPPKECQACGEALGVYLKGRPPQFVVAVIAEMGKLGYARSTVNRARDCISELLPNRRIQNGTKKNRNGQDCKTWQLIDELEEEGYVPAIPLAREEDAEISGLSESF